MDHQNNLEGFNYDLNHYQDTPPADASIFGAFDLAGQQISGSLPHSQYFGDQGDGIDENDPKRRRIARVCTSFEIQASAHADPATGLRHVPQEEDQM